MKIKNIFKRKNNDGTAKTILYSNEWKDICNITQTHRAGIYLIECLGDNHTFYEVHELPEGVTLMNLYINDNTRHDGWMVVKPLRYFFVPFPTND